MPELIIAEDGYTYYDTPSGRELYEMHKRYEETRNKLIKGVDSLDTTTKIELNDLTRSLCNFKTGLVHLHFHFENEKFNNLIEAVKELEMYVKELFKKTKLEDKYFQMYESMIKHKYNIKHWTERKDNQYERA